MAKLPEHIRELGHKYGLQKEDFWDCHGTWVVYHRALEKAAAGAGVKWQAPQVLECDATKAVSVIATGELDGRIEWSIGEANPKNNKNAYPWAMAEKRAKDRVILKLLGFAGEVYSEEEADDFKDAKPARQAAPRGEVAPLDAKKSNRVLKADYERLLTGMQQCHTVEALDAWGSAMRDEIDDLPEDYRESLRGQFRKTRDGLKAVAA